MFIEDPNAAKFALITLFFAILTGLFFYHMIKFNQDAKNETKQKADEEAKSARDRYHAFMFDELCCQGGKPKGDYEAFLDTEMMR